MAKIKVTNVKLYKKVIDFVCHGTWTHIGKPNKHCTACRDKIGFYGVYLKNMKKRK